MAQKRKTLKNKWEVIPLPAISRRTGTNEDDEDTYEVTQPCSVRVNGREIAILPDLTGPQAYDLERMFNNVAFFTTLR